MNEILQSDVALVVLTPIVGVAFLVFGIWALDVATLGRLPDHFDNNMNAAVVAGARLIAVGAVVSAAIVSGYDVDILEIVALCVNGLAIHLFVSVIVAYAYRGASDVAQKTGPLLPCAVLVASAQVPAALISIASIIS